MVCHNYRRIPAIALAKKMISEGALGKIYHFRARYAQDWLVDPEFPLRWRLQKGISGSGAHGDINVHIIDLARYLVGEFKEVCGLMHTFITERRCRRAPARSKSPAAKAARQDGQGDRGRRRDCSSGVLSNGALANLEATALRARAARTTSNSKSTAAKARSTLISRT